MKKVIIALLCIVLCISFASCSNDETQPEPEPTTKATEPPKPKVPMVEDVLGQDGIYCLHADGSVTKASKLTQIEEDTWIFTGGTPLIIDRKSGDSLIYIGDLVSLSAGTGGQFEMDFCAEQFYYSGKKADLMEIEEFEGVELEGEVKENGIFYWMNVDTFFKPFGLTVYLDVIDDGMGYILSKEPVAYSYGYYEGTKWVGTNATNNKMFYDVTDHGGSDDYVFRTDVIKGKNGYFTIDLEGIEAGLYINEFKGNGHIYAIDIR